MSGIDVNDILEEFETTSRNEISKSLYSENLYEELITAMINERMSPELLPYKKELLNQVLRRISNQQQDLLDSHEYGEINAESGVVSTDFKLQLMIIETDIERFNYLVRLYLRTRLTKLDKYTIHYINETVGNGKILLSPEEEEYIDQHFKILTKLYNNCFLKKMPSSLTLLDDTTGGQSMIEIPDTESHVFIKSITKSTIFVTLDDGEELNIENEGIYVVKYSSIKRYIEIGDIVLI
ncbi:DNA replication complex GINS protein SLD5 [Scheffersomyces amazonensis]|uniref:DNA replication complex GINS protein SLD5 n=1 Tax=Scheffersomyces amazonensis TaxID=1078765 RepID=UPI00315DBA1F